MMGLSRHIDGVDQRLLDLLVDGELSDEQERAVIARLEVSPDGWRRCALAFLESRCWQRAAQTVMQPRPGEPCPTARCRTGTAWHVPSWTWALALAALFLVAFGVGALLRPGGWRASLPDSAQPVAPALPSTLAHVERPVGQPDTNDVGPAGDLYLGDLRLVNDSGSEIDVPVYDWNQHVAEELLYRSQPLLPDVMRQLKRHQVRSSRSYTHVQLQDGRQVVVPVQEVDIQRVGGLAY